MNKISLIPKYIVFLILVFFSGMLLFSFFRVTLLFINYNQAINIPVSQILFALLNRGGIFDAAVNSYILFLPFILLAFSNFIPSLQNIFSKISFGIISLFYIIAIALLATDIPYFDYFNSRLTNGILNWTDDLWLMIKVRLPDYYPVALIFLIISVSFYIWLKIIRRRTLRIISDTNDSVTKKIISFVIVFFLFFVGFRGDLKFGTYPLKVAETFFSDYSFINQLGLNPVYSFFNSFGNPNVKFLAEDEAIHNTRNYLSINGKYNSPIARKIEFDGNSVNPNVVVFIVESLSAFKLKRYGNKNNLMPFIDSIAEKSLTFDNVYADGVHTYNGIYSSLFGLPSIPNVKAMVSPLIAGQKLSGLSTVLHKHGYQSVFFCSGDKLFDNMNGFLKNNDFDEVIGQEVYPQDVVISEWGVPDHVIFDYAVPKLQNLSENKKPFLAVILTISTHESCAIPDWVDFKPNAEDSYDARFQYTDWAVSKFINELSKKDFFKNTIFVFVADHGQNFDQTYDLSLAYHHTPLIFYSPALISPASYSKPGLQIDLFPTLMALLKLPYVNNTLGIDLVKENRPFAFFSADDKLGCLDDENYLIIRNNGPESMYKYKTKGITNQLNENKALADNMKTYSYSMLQTVRWILEHKLASLPDITVK